MFSAGLHRRDALKVVAGASLALAAAPAAAQTFTANAIQGTLGEGLAFNAATVVDLARLLSKKAYNAPATDLPDPFNGLNYEQYIGIRALPNALVWSGEGRGFTIEPLHRGYAFQSAVSPVPGRGRRRPARRL